MYKPAILINTPANKKAEWTILGSRTTPKAVPIIINPKIPKETICTPSAKFTLFSSC
jgi:hypothetical protein